MASGRLSKVKGKVLDIPNPPTIGTATAGVESVSIAFTADSSGKGGPTRSYIAKSNPGNITATGSTSPINITGLTVGTSYTISVAGVNETGTGEYSSASGSAVPTELPNSYESIATVTVGSGGTTSVSFTSIASTWKHLQIRWIARENTGSVSTPDENVRIRFNSDTGSNYSIHRLNGNGSTVSADGYANESDMVATGFSGNGATASIYGAGVIDILDYANTNKYKTVRALSGADQNGSGSVWFNSGNWRSTSAITSIELRESTNGFKQYSHFALYGIKGA